MNAFNFSHADELHDEAPRLDRENGYLYVYVRPHTPGVSFSSTVLLDGVVIDIDADARVTGFEIFPDLSKRFRDVPPPVHAMQVAETMWMRVSELEEGSMAHAYDESANLLEVRLFPDDSTTQVHLLSRQVSIATTRDRISAIYVRQVPPPL